MPSIHAPSDKSVQHRTFIGASWMIGFRLASRLLGLVSTLVLARLLVPADFALIAIASTIAAATESVTELGVQDSLVRHKDDAHKLYDTGFTMQLFRGLLTSLGLAAAAPLASRWFDEPRLIPVLLVLSVVYALSGLENIGIVEFRRNMRFDLEFRLAIVPRILGFLATVIMALTLHSYWALVIGIAVGKVTRLIATYQLHPYRPRCSLRGWRDLAGFSFWMWMSALAYIVWLRSDPAIMGPALGTAQLGVVLMAYELALLPSTEILAPIAAALFTGIVAARHAGTDTSANVFRIAIGLVMVIGPLALVISADAGPIVAVLLGSKWDEAQKLVAIVACSGFFGPVSYVCSISLTANGKVKNNFVIVAAGAAVKVVVLVLAATTHDATNLAFASLLIVVVEAGLFTFVLHRHGGALRPVMGSIARMIAAGLVSAGAMLATGIAWHATTLSAVPALLYGAPVGLLGLLAYGAALYAFWRIAGTPPGPEADVIGAAVKVVPGLHRLVT